MLPRRKLSFQNLIKSLVELTLFTIGFLETEHKVFSHAPVLHFCFLDCKEESRHPANRLFNVHCREISFPSFYSTNSICILLYAWTISELVTIQEVFAL